MNFLKCLKYLIYLSQINLIPDIEHLNPIFKTHLEFSKLINDPEFAPNLALDGFNKLKIPNKGGRFDTNIV